jgi:hypothetical protein
MAHWSATWGVTSKAAMEMLQEDTTPVEPSDIGVPDAPGVKECIGENPRFEGQEASTDVSDASTSVSVHPISQLEKQPLDSLTRV